MLLVRLFMLGTGTNHNEPSLLLKKGRAQQQLWCNSWYLCGQPTIACMLSPMTPTYTCYAAHAPQAKKQEMQHQQQQQQRHRRHNKQQQQAQQQQGGPTRPAKVSALAPAEPPPRKYMIDATFVGGVARFANH
jgi:hemolysin activation/secretion protein